MSLIGHETHIGKGSVTLKAVVPKLNKTFTFNMELTYQYKKKTVRKGIIHMEASIQPDGNNDIIYITLFSHD